MKLFSLYTQSHEVLKNDWFLKTLPTNLEPHLTKVVQQNFDNGDFRSTTWMSVASEKLIFLSEQVSKHQKETIAWMDVDIQFFKPVHDLLTASVENADIAFQTDRPGNHINGGVIVIRCNSRTRSFFEAAAKKNMFWHWTGDQGLMERQLKESVKQGLRWNLLPESIFAPSQILFKNVSSVIKTTIFPEQALRDCIPQIPKDIVLHHANVTPAFGKMSSVDQKIRQMKLVRHWLTGSETPQG